MALQRFWSLRLVPVAASLALALIACGGTQITLTGDDNNPDMLAAALARAQAPTVGPRNATGNPMAFLVARGTPKKLVAFDLSSKAELWRVETDITSKVHVGGEFITHLEGKRTLVGRDVRTGKKLWTHDIGPDPFVGVTADSQHVYYTAQDKSGDQTVWVLTALEGRSGDELWQTTAPGSMGAPAARGGLVFSPFLKQWLTVLDAQTGEQLARIRGDDEEISFVRTTSENVYFGSKAGVFLLDKRAASGRVAKSTYGRAKLPQEFVRVHYHWDAFDPIQTGYSAYDRNRVLWRGKVMGDKLGFANDRIVVHTYRFFFGFAAESGELTWAYSHPRIDVVASSHTGSAIGFVSMLGEIGALDAGTGRIIYSAKVEGQFIGATFDADGWKPTEQGEDTLGTAAALASIAKDRDARFNDVKRFAVTALSQLRGPDVTRDLLALIQSDKTPSYLYETAVEVLVSRRDPEGLSHLALALDVQHDYIKGVKPRAVGVIALSIAAMAGKEMNPASRASATRALLLHLKAPETTASDLVGVIKALGTIGGGSELPALRSFLLAYRADPAFSTQTAAVSATIDVLLGNGGPQDREIVSFVAADNRTQASIAEYAERALEQTAAGVAAGGEPEDAKKDEAPKPNK